MHNAAFADILVSEPSGLLVVVESSQQTDLDRWHMKGLSSDLMQRYVLYIYTYDVLTPSISTLRARRLLAVP